MKAKSLLAFLFPIALSLGLVACSKVEYDYKALGFSYSTEMEAAHAKGYHTKAKLLEMTKPTAVAAAPTPVASAAQVAASEQPQAIAEAPKFELAATIDCSDTKIEVVRFICNDDDLAKLNMQLSQAYLGAMDSAEDKEKMKSEQTDWLKRTIGSCSDNSCLNDAFRQQITKLRR